MAAYGFVMYCWPLVVFYPHLKGKSRRYTFMFCSTVSVMLANTFVLSLGLLHILYKPVTAILFYGVFLWRLLCIVRPSARFTDDLRRVRHGTLTTQRLMVHLRDWVKPKLHSLWERVRRSMKGYWLEYSLLAVLLIFGTLYFSWSALQVHAYGCGDEYVHHKWIYGLENGQIFSAGIYPEAMHCFVYLIGVISGISTFHILLFLGGVHVHVLLVSIYIFSKSVFHWRYTPLFVLVLFLTIDSTDRDQIFTMSRLGWTLPMEFGFHGIFLCAYSLVRFLHRETPKGKLNLPWKEPKKWGRLFRDEDLFIFIVSIAVTIAAHFYTTLMAVYVCVPVATVYFTKVFSRKNFIVLSLSVITAFMLAVVPMALAFAEGIEPEASLYWAINVIKKSQNSLTETESTEGDDAGAADPDVSTDSETENDSASLSVSAQEDTETEEPDLVSRLFGLIQRIYRKNYQLLFPGTFGLVLAWASVMLAAVSFSVINLRFLVKNRGIRYRMAANRYRNYLAVVFTSFFLVLMRAPGTLGIPSLMDGHRLCVTIDVLAFMVFGCGLDILFSCFQLSLPALLVEVASVMLCIGIYLFAQASGAFHGYLLFQMTRYPVVADITETIINNMPLWQYTILSPTDELYHVIYTGYHEEVLDLLEDQRKDNYTIPTPYVFVFLEKHPLYYVQYNFADGPLWLASKKHVENFGGYGTQYPNIIHGEISEESALKEIRYGSQRSKVESTLSSRIVMESKLYVWYQEFTRLHPYAGTVVYEDDDILCYCFTQNPYDLYTLSILPENYYANIGQQDSTAKTAPSDSGAGR